METSHNIKLVAFGDLNTPTYYQLITINFLRIWAILLAGRAPRNLRGAQRSCAQSGDSDTCRFFYLTFAFLQCQHLELNDVCY